MSIGARVPRWDGAGGVREHAPVLLVFAVLFLMPFGRLEELPLLAMAVLGLRRLWHEGKGLFRDPRVQLLSAVFLAYWIPILVSAFGAVHPEKTWVVTAAMPRYWLAGLFALGVLAAAVRLCLLWRLCAWLLVFWTLDALVQAAVGYNLLGFPHPVQPIERVNGVFGSGNYKLGPMLALFSPLLVEHARRHWPAWATGMALLGLTTVVLLTTTRIGWVMLGVVALAYLSILARRRPARAALASGLLAVALLGMGSLTYQASEPFRERVNDTLAVLDGSRESVDRALSVRLDIWEASVAMAGEHWLTGVGARSYRHAYPDYAGPDDPWVREDEGTGAHYAHHLVLEVLTETGAVGLAGFALLIVIMARCWSRAPPIERGLMFPFALALGAAVFPLNSHYAVYATGWSITLWWLVMGFCAASPGRRAKEVE